MSGPLRRRPLYVETLVRADLERLWSRTQDPVEHVRWDLRFTRITPTGQAPQGHQTFEYLLHLPGRQFHGRSLAGTGTSAGELRRPDGSRTSVLRFATPDRLSPLRHGSGYWRYVPTAAGVRFLTGFDYQPGWGRIGTVVDAVLVRPVLGWMTAWSFDRLRLWIERDQDPAESTRRALLDAGVRLGLLVTAGSVGTPAVRSRLSRSSRAAFALAAVAALLTPAPARVPRAGRCLRRPPDRGSARAPRSLDLLPTPGGRP